MERIIILFLSFFVPKIDVAYRNGLFIVCILLTISSCGFLIYYLDGTKITPLRNVKYPAWIYLGLIGGYLLNLLAIALIWSINIYISILSLNYRYFSLMESKKS